MGLSEWRREIAMICRVPRIALSAFLILFICYYFFFSWFYGERLDNKNATIEMLRERIALISDQEKARLRVVKGRSADVSLDAITLDALTVRSGRLSVHEVFLRLTDQRHLKSSWNPLVEPWRWEGKQNPNTAEIERQAAIRYLWEKGYISSVTDLGVGNYIFNASDEALRMRKEYDKLKP